MVDDFKDQLDLPASLLYLERLAEVLHNTEREHAKFDTPEGTYYIRISGTLADNIADKLAATAFWWRGYAAGRDGVIGGT
jgi:hypothetical protein